MKMLYLLQCLTKIRNTGLREELQTLLYHHYLAEFVATMEEQELLGVDPKAILQAFLTDENMHVSIDDGVSPRQPRKTVPFPPVGDGAAPSSALFEVAGSLERGMFYTNYSADKPGPPMWTNWGTFVLAAPDRSALPPGHVYVDNLDFPTTHHLVTFPVPTPMVVVKGCRPCIWSASEMVQPPWGQDWYHVESVQEGLGSALDAFLDKSPDHAAYMVLATVPKLVTVRVMSTAHQMAMLEAETGTHVPPLRPVVPADAPRPNIWVLIGPHLAPISCMLAAVSRFDPDELVMNPSAPEWETLLGRPPATRQLVVCTKASIPAGVFPGLVRACVDHVISFLVVKSMSLKFMTFEGLTADILAAFLDGVPNAHIYVVRNFARVLTFPKDCMWPPRVSSLPSTDPEPTPT